MPENPSNPRPARRQRYPGTHPRQFEQKYKELDRERYPEQGEKVRGRGQTPAGTHVPVMLSEVLAALRPQPGDIYVDGTLGWGGHAEVIAARVLPGGRVIGLDLDPEAVEATRERLLGQGIAIVAVRSSFAGISKVLQSQGLEAADLVLADLGVSSMQIDNPARGFSFKQEGPLDLRLDRSKGSPAAQWLAKISEEELEGILDRHGDERDAATIAVSLKAAAASGQLQTTQDLTRVVLQAKGLPPRWRAASSFDTHPAARTFQAVRIALNREDENLRQFLRVLPYVLKPGGRAAIITFHSGEERIVEAAFQDGLTAGLYSDAPAQPVRPTPAEVRANPRSRSAKLWRAVRAVPAVPAGG